MERIEFRAVPAAEGGEPRVSVYVNGAWFRAAPYSEGGPHRLLVNLPLHAAEEALRQLALAIAELKAPGEAPRS